MVSLTTVRARSVSHLPVLLAAVVSCTTAEAPLPPSVSIAPRTVMVGDTVMMKETAQGFPGGQVWWIGPSALEVVQRIDNGPSFYGSGAGVATIKVQLVDSTGANVIAEDSALLTVVAPPASNRPAFTQIEASADRGCGLTGGGDVYCWGNTPTFHSREPTCERQFHQSYPTFCNSVPSRVIGVPQFKLIDGGTASVCGITLADETFCWPGLASSFYFGQMGIVPGGIRFTSISVEMGPDFNYEDAVDHVCGLTATGDIYCWTRGDFTTTPIKIPGGITYKAVAVGGWWKGGAGLYRACGLDTSGAAFCWGTEALGDGNPAPSSEQTTPVAVGDTLRFQAISVGGLEACGLTVDGAVYCWNGDPFHPVLAPTLIDTSIRFKAISVEDQSFCGIASDATLYCWSSYPQMQPPAQVATPFHFKTISVGDPANCGLTVEGPEVCWGYNGWGFVGNGAIGIGGESPTPVVGQRVLP